MTRLYVVVRNEMASMTAGRIAAQVSHASTKMMNDIQKSNNADNKEMLTNWLNEADGFGTTIVLRPSKDKDQVAEIRNLVNLSRFSFPTVCSDVVIDPEYYIMDGNVPVRQENVLTCAYFLGDVDQIKSLLGHLDLL